MLLGYKFIVKTHTYKPEEADLWTGKDVIDADEQMWLEKEAVDRAARKRAGWLYGHTIAYLF